MPEDNASALHMTKDQYRNLSKSLVNNILHPELIEPVVTKVEPNSGNVPLIKPLVETVTSVQKESMNEKIIKPVETLIASSKQT
jgi:hypothetical protein